MHNHLPPLNMMLNPFAYKRDTPTNYLKNYILHISNSMGQIFGLNHKIYVKLYGWPTLYRKII